MFHIHRWRTFRDDGYWLYQFCQGCQKRRLKNKPGVSGQRPNPAWMQGGKLPVPIGEKGAD